MPTLLLQAATAVTETSSVNSQVALWVIGVLCSFIGALLLILLQRVLKQGDDTNSKVTLQGATLGRVELSVSTLDGRVNDLHKWKNEQQAKELQSAAAEIVSLKRQNEIDRRVGEPDRRHDA